MKYLWMCVIHVLGIWTDYVTGKYYFFYNGEVFFYDGQVFFYNVQFFFYNGQVCFL